MQHDPQDSRSTDLLVVGAAFFEAFVPVDVTPVPGVERFVDAIDLGLGGALNSATVAAALGVSTCFMYPRTTWLVDGAVGECCRRTGIRDAAWGRGGAPFVTLVWADTADRAFVSSCDWGTFAGCPGFPASSHVHVGGLPEFNLLRRQAADARKHGAFVSTCTGWDPAALESLASETSCPLDVIFMNRAEAECVCGTIEAALSRLPGRVAVEVVVTDGPAGATASVGGRIWKAAAPVVDVVDPTGAGDGFAAAYLSRRIDALKSGGVFDPGTALEFACGVASRIVGIRGGVVMDRSQVTSR